MYDPCYKNYQDPRLQPQPEPEGPFCGDCDYYRDVQNKQESNGLTHCIGVCIFEVFQANTFEELATANLVEVDPQDEPCTDYRGDE